MKTIYSLAAILLFSSPFVKAQNYGFEAPPSTPPLNWALVTGTWRTVTDTARTGTQAMAISAPATTGTTAGSAPAGQILNSSGGTHIITILWAKSNEAANARVNIGYRRVSSNILNPTTTSSGQAPNMTTDWTRIVSISAAPVAAGAAGPAIRAFRTAANPTNTVIYIDDMIIYENATAVADTTKPDAMTNAILSGNTSFSWTNGLDNHADASGSAGYVIIRADGVPTNLPQLNDQAMYATTHGEAGVATFTFDSVLWTVVASSNDTSITTFTDATAQPGNNYTWVIYNRDRAYNYSTGVAVAAGCAGQPAVGTASLSAASLCEGDSLELSLSIPAEPGIRYQWQQAAVGSSNFVDIPGALGVDYTLQVSTAQQYRCVASCAPSGLGDTSNIVSTSVTQLVQTGPITFTFAGAQYTFRVNAAQNYDLISWDFDDGTTDTGLVVVHTFMNNRLHIVRVNATNSCSEDSSAIAINITAASVQENDVLGKILVYPNPASERLFLETEEAFSRVKLLNVLGAVVLEAEFPKTETHSIEIGQFPAGVYWVQMFTENGRSATKMIQIQR